MNRKSRKDHSLLHSSLPFFSRYSAEFLFREVNCLQLVSHFPSLLQAFSINFFGEWGDKSQVTFPSALCFLVPVS